MSVPVMAQLNKNIKVLYPLAARNSFSLRLVLLVPNHHHYLGHGEGQDASGDCVSAAAWAAEGNLLKVKLFRLLSVEESRARSRAQPLSIDQVTDTDSSLTISLPSLSIHSVTLSLCRLKLTQTKMQLLCQSFVVENTNFVAHFIIVDILLLLCSPRSYLARQLLQK